MFFTPTAANLANATAWLDAWLDENGCAPKARFALQAVLEEVFMNIVNHSGATRLELTLTREGDDVTLLFADDGAPFNPHTQEEPDVTLPAEDRSIGGLGILMIRRMTDHQQYARKQGCNRLTLRRRLV